MGRLANSWQMTKTSFRVIGQDKELLWLPILSFLATLVAVAAVAGVGFVAGVFPQVTNPDGSFSIGGAATAFLMYIALAFVQVFFHAATVAGANERLEGGDPTVGSALGKAWQHVGRLFLWSVIVATVNLILQWLREKSGLGRLAAGIAGIAWNLATYFVVPTLLFEDKTIGDSLRNSGSLFKKTWGESVVGEFGIAFVGGLFTVLWLFIGFALLFVLGSTLGLAGVIVGAVLLVLGVVLLSVLFTVAAAVYKTALYRFASQGHAGGDFSDAQLAHAYRTR